jgi:hypothetical protein
MLYIIINQFVMGFIKVQKTYILPNQFSSVKAQLMLYCFSNNIKVNENDLDCLTYLALDGCTNETIKRVVEKNVFKSEQVVRNYMTKYKKLGLIVKSKGKTKVINPEAALVDNLIGIEVKMGNIKK